ncbi:MAG TPA: HAD-IB family phosphatase [Acidimicrobiales bacterium]|jgi:HAD superfamily hydrolase (TIGR01490 family)|nr:HAD-IB family phosphatase [Acidimicrobiales bacterium]
MLREALAGQRIAITGATGFLGTALVERLLRQVPDAELVLIVRPGRRGVADRVRREILRNDCFDRLRRLLGDDFDAEMARRVTPIAGDVTQDGLGLDAEGQAIFATCSTVIHSAASVSFDAPLDSAVEINLLGPSRVAATMAAVRSPAAIPADAAVRSPATPADAAHATAAAHTTSTAEAPSPANAPNAAAHTTAAAEAPITAKASRAAKSTKTSRATKGPAPAPSPRSPHLIAVSTAYVAGTRRGDAPEALLPDTPFATEIEWRPEIVAARRARADYDAESRHPRQLASFTKAARSELGAAGVPVLAAKAEKLRQEWVKDRMVDAGKARAQGLGWPDAYAYTKALGERALMESRGDVRVSIVRPSIIESALAEPVPGWIRGFRMAEPVIISLGKGLLKEFPGLPEGVVDVIPVDLVVAAIIAVAANGGPPEGTPPEVFQVASGSRNPLRYRQLVELVRGWFGEHPLADDNGQPIVVPEWSYPGRGRVRKQLAQATRMLETAEKGLLSLPLRGRQAELSARLEEKRAEAERALGYVELYGAYTETEAVFRMEHLLELWNTVPEDDQADFLFDPAGIEWRHYIRDTHMPSVVTHARVRLAGPSRRVPAAGTREERGRRAILAPERHMAVFDLENTLIASNVVDSYAWLATRRISDEDRLRLVLRTLREAPRLLALDRQDRGDFLRHFYRRYEGAPVARLEHDAWELWSDLLLTKAFPAGIRRVREHRRLGHRTLLITGALDVAIEPLRPLFDDVMCASLGVKDGRYTGELLAAPPTGEARALLMADYAAARGFELAEAVAYADSASDLPMLEAVGHPVAVNPETKLAAIARKRGWHVEQWPRSPGGPRPLLPIARMAANS